MSRWITQLTVDFSGRVHVVDNNGIAWRLLEPRGDSAAAGRWERLPALPSVPAIGAAAAPPANLMSSSSSSSSSSFEAPAAAAAIGETPTTEGE